MHIHVAENITLIKSCITIYWFRSDHSNFSYKSAHVGELQREEKRLLLLEPHCSFIRAIPAVRWRRYSSCSFYFSTKSTIHSIQAVRIRSYKPPYSSIRLIEWLSGTARTRLSYSLLETFSNSPFVYFFYFRSESARFKTLRTNK